MYLVDLSTLSEKDDSSLTLKSNFVLEGPPNIFWYSENDEIRVGIFKIDLSPLEAF